jgi:hypothetical protein
MLQSVLQVVMDPRVWLGGGLLFFGGLVAFAEISHRIDGKQQGDKNSDELDEH